MNRIKTCFEELKRTNKKALIPYIVAGDPIADITVTAMHALVQGGANIIELGLPFSDPMADGPVIQQATERALKHHINIDDILALIATFRQTDSTTPIVLMGYLNPIEVMGYAIFAKKAKQAGVDGILLVDMPPEESGDFLPAMQAENIDVIYLIAPTSDETRIKMICEKGSGYLYYVSLKGVTGAGHLDLNSVAQKIKQIRTLTDLPLGVGFGIKDPETASSMAKLADAVVVGSVLVNQFKALQTQPEKIPATIQTIINDMRLAMDDKI